MAARFSCCSEMGFNAGHSAIVWLENTSVQLLNTFDIFSMPYSAPARRFISARYRERVRFVAGNTKVTVPEYVQAVKEARQPACDLWMVDADHFKNTYLDFRNAIASSHPARRANGSTMIVADDTTERFPYVLKYWRSLVERGNITNPRCERVDLGVVSGRRGPERNVKGWCVGDVVRDVA